MFVCFKWAFPGTVDYYNSLIMLFNAMVPLCVLSVVSMSGVSINGEPLNGAILVHIRPFTYK